MKRIILPLLLLLVPTLATAFDTGLLDRVGQTYQSGQPGLESYAVTLETGKFEEILAKMTANMPPDLPRPAPPKLVMYWTAASGRTLIRGEGSEAFPYMQEMIQRFSREFAVDLRNLFLPPAGAGKRAELLKGATVESFATKAATFNSERVDIAFPAPVDLQGAFYGDGLDLPQSGVLALGFDLDTDQGILRRIDIVTDDERRLIVEIRHRLFNGKPLPEEIRITSPDGSVDDLFAASFAEIDGYLLPQRQEFRRQRSGKTESTTVTFSEYRINTPLTPPVLEALGEGR